MTPPAAPAAPRDAPDGAPAAACVLEGVRVHYDATAALDGVDLRVRAGERVALIGPSGAGKTTLLRVLAGMVRPTAGRVLVHGRSLADLRPGRELTGLVGMIQQRLDLVPQLSVKHNVQAGLLGRWGLLRSLAALLLPLEVPAARAAVRRVGIEDKFLRRVARLSGGEQQRVALARLLLQDPQVILADEPVSSLDPALADDLLALLADLSREAGKTLVASLHVPDLARRHFDRIVGLRAGQVAFDLPAHEVTAEALDAVYRLLAPVPAPRELRGAQPDADGTGRERVAGADGTPPDGDGDGAGRDDPAGAEQPRADGTRQAASP